MWLVCLKQVLAGYEVEYSCYAGFVKICLLVTIPEACHEEIIVGDQIAESLLDINKPLPDLGERWWAVDNT